MRILLLRHGEPDYANDTLTEKGNQEAELLSRRMANYDITDFYVSPLRRAQQTAAYTLKRMNRSAEELPWLAEFRGHYWDAEAQRNHMPWDLPPRVWPTLKNMDDPEHWTENDLFREGNVTEIWRETTEGVDALMARYGYRKDGHVWLCEDNRDITLALFCHFGITMAIVAYLTEQSPLILWHHTMTLPTSLTELVTEERVKGEVSFRMTKMGDLTHLESVGHPRSNAGLFPERYNGIQTTDPAVNGMNENGRKE